MLKYAQVISFATDKYPFDKVLAATVFKVPRLDCLHVSWAQHTGKDKASYGDNLALRKLMQTLSDDSPFYKLYHAWIVEQIAPKFGKQISYSAHPQMRVHLAGSGGVSEFHRDVDVTGRYDQINCYLPFTDVFDSNTLWCESDYGLKDYRPINLKFGEAFIWDGGFLQHGTFRNETAHTRVSCDFRFSVKKAERVRAPWSEILRGRTLVTQELKKCDPPSAGDSSEPGK
jgi:hypothetical protein